MFDSHCHLHDARMSAVREEALIRARAAGVRGFMLAGVNPEDWRAAAALAALHDDCYVSYGIHPQAIAEEGAFEHHLAVLEQAAFGRDGWRAPQALGEIGLDAHNDVGSATLELQVEAFRAQLDIAKRANLPVLLHVLHAHGRALDVLRRDKVPARGGVVHSYSGSPELVNAYVKLGLHVSFSGTVTRANVKRAKVAATRVPQEWLLVETDAPDQTPAPCDAHALNEPANLLHVIAGLAQLRGENAEELARITESNARRLFGIA